jgi:hypothetical protein
MCFQAGRIEVMLEIKCVYWTFCSCCCSSAGKADGPHRAVKAGEKGIADCTWSRVGYADCRMLSTMAWLMVPVSSSGLPAECPAGCFAECLVGHPAGYPAETFVFAFVAVASEVSTVLGARMKASLAVVVAVAVAAAAVT